MCDTGARQNRTDTAVVGVPAADGASVMLPHQHYLEMDVRVYFVPLIFRFWWWSILPTKAMLTG